MCLPETQIFKSEVGKARNVLLRGEKFESNLCRPDLHTLSDVSDQGLAVSDMAAPGE